MMKSTQLLSFDGQGCLMVRMDNGQRKLVAHATEFGLPFCEPIVRAVNSHDKLREALEDMLDMWKRHCAPRNIELDSQVKQARAALKESEAT